jgi:glycosyltransferase involved in cell wall biosynthesis
MNTILHIFRSYGQNASLFNDIVKAGDGHFNNIVCYLSGADDGNNQMAEITSDVVYLNLSKHQVTWRCPGTVIKIKELIQLHNVDLVDCHMWRPMPIGALASLFSPGKVKVVGVFHGVKARLSVRMKLLYYFTLKRMSRIVSVSEGGVEDIKALLWGVDPDKLVAIPNGLDLTHFSTATAGDKKALFGAGLENKRIFITVSRLALKKNLERFLRAFSHVHSAYPNAGLVIVGDGDLKPRLESFVADKGLASSVTFMDFRDDIPTLLKTADIYAIPSLREGLPRSLVEAMAVGKPVLASRINGHEEVVSDPEHGRLVDAVDVDDIAAAIEYFMRLPQEELEAQGQAAREYAHANLHRSKMMAKYLNLFQETLA